MRGRSPFRPSRAVARWSLVAVALLIAGAGSSARAQSLSSLVRNSPEVLKVFEGVVTKSSPSTLRIQCEGKDVALGTVVGPGGWVVTKASLLTGPATCRLPDGRVLDARVVGLQSDFDLAMLKVDATGLAAVSFRPSKAMEAGSWLASPGTDGKPVAVGVLSVPTRDVRIRPGMRAIAPSPDSGYLGVSLGENEVGAKVLQIMPNTAAEKAGLKADDVIVWVSGKAMKDVDTVMSYLRSRKPGEEILLRVRRGESEVELKAKLGKRPNERVDRSAMQNSMGSKLSDRRTGFPTILQHDAVIKPEDCGGPLVDLDGKVVGINIARAGRTESYAVPTEALQPLLMDLMSGKLAPKEQTITAENRVKAAEAAVARAKAALEAAEKELERARNESTQSSSKK